ncbi:MAG: hypothetical protein JKY65_13835 [Planctomycetes bacterium]|nr:hypothetical protein [Planctomycetota bacterium]
MSVQLAEADLEEVSPEEVSPEEVSPEEVLSHDLEQVRDPGPVEAEGEPRCPYCHEALRNVGSGPTVGEEAAAERPVACTDCQTPLHARCAQLHGRCVTLGCGGRSFAFVDSLPRPRIRSARVRARRHARPTIAVEPPECPHDWWRRDAPLLLLGLAGLVAMACIGSVS